MTPEERKKVEERAQSFLAKRKTVSLATMSAGWPLASYAPFVRQNSDLFIYTSSLSGHTKNLNENHRASAMAVEEESIAAGNLSAAVRMTFSCTADEVERGDPKREEILDLFQEMIGAPFIKVRELGDFTLFRLRPFEVVYVEDFERSYRLNKYLTESQHVRGTQPGAAAHKA